mmetsp:Transcript_23568/g.73751  ORF Transcript_23568/g.73751 Transcript_23568/m.73751 type:complete len:247 (+) Transcript_23568:2-742(+)
MPPGAYGSFGGSGSSSSQSWRGDDKPASSGLDARGFDAPVVVDHTGALVAPRADLDAPAPARRRSFDLAERERAVAFARPGLAAAYARDDVVDYAGAPLNGAAAYGARASANNKRYRKASSATNNYRLLSDSLQRGLHAHQHQQQQLPSHHYPPPHADPSLDAHLVDAAKEEDSKLLLDFFVKVHERCGSDDDLLRAQQQHASPQTAARDAPREPFEAATSDADTARVRKRTRASLQQEQQQHAVA